MSTSPRVLASVASQRGVLRVELSVDERQLVIVRRGKGLYPLAYVTLSVEEGDELAQALGDALNQLERERGTASWRQPARFDADGKPVYTDGRPQEDE